MDIIIYLGKAKNKENQSTNIDTIRHPVMVAWAHAIVYNNAIGEEGWQMPKKKVYAVKKGLQAGIYDTWDECRRMVHGFPGAVYKSFGTRQEAEEYLKECPPSVKAPEGSQLIAYVDGSFDKKIRRYSFGCVFLTPDGRIFKEGGSGNNLQSLELRNVTGEMLGAMFAVQWAKANGFAAIDIRYDYAGIEQWAMGGWKAKNTLTQKYAAFMGENRLHLAITFTKIAAHTGDKYNEEADRLAKEALTGTDSIPKARRCIDGP